MAVCAEGILVYALVYIYIVKKGHCLLLPTHSLDCGCASPGAYLQMQSIHNLFIWGFYHGRSFIELTIPPLCQCFPQSTASAHFQTAFDFFVSYKKVPIQNSCLAAPFDEDIDVSSDVLYSIVYLHFYMSAAFFVLFLTFQQHYL